MTQIHPTAPVEVRAELGRTRVFGPSCPVEAGALLGGECVMDSNLLMVSSHVGHDCHVGSHCILVNHVLLGAFAEVHDGAYLGGASVVAERCRIGRLAMIG